MSVSGVDLLSLEYEPSLLKCSQPRKVVFRSWCKVDNEGCCEFGDCGVRLDDKIAEAFRGTRGDKSISMDG